MEEHRRTYSWRDIHTKVKYTFWGVHTGMTYIRSGLKHCGVYNGVYTQWSIHTVESTHSGIYSQLSLHTVVDTYDGLCSIIPLSHLSSDIPRAVRLPSDSLHFVWNIL